MKKVIRLTEDDLIRIVKRVINEDINISSDERIKLTNNDNFLLVIPLTIDASCKYGATTKWCISGKERNVFMGYKNVCHTIGMVMIKDPKIQELLGTKKIAINVWNTSLEVYNEVNRFIDGFQKKIVEYGIVDDFRKIFKDFINYHNSICNNKVDEDFFDKNIMKNMW